jgi:hypothetical protein
VKRSVKKGLAEAVLKKRTVCTALLCLFLRDYSSQKTREICNGNPCAVAYGGGHNAEI